jgi:prepilin-type N-terminal cleavage/methylation domain-containing protein
VINSAGGRHAAAFTLIELLVVISVISLLFGIGAPAFNSVREKAKALQSMNNQRQIVGAVNFFATDNDDRYPASVAKVGFTDRWSWSNPTKVAADDLPMLGQSRSVSSYLGSYVDKSETMVCPRSPSRFQYLDEAWAQADAWDHPDTPMKLDTLDGNYCLYWNYQGHLGEKDGRQQLFNGPRRPSGSRRTSDLLITDYFGFNNYRTPGAFVSCERFVGANVLPPTDIQSSCWTTAPDPEKPSPNIPLNAGYTDGHVESFSSLDIVPLRVIKDRNGYIPYADDELGPGIFYLPKNGF